MYKRTLKKQFEEIIYEKINKTKEITSYLCKINQKFRTHKPIPDIYTS